MCFPNLQCITKTIYELSREKNNKSHSICLKVLHAAELQWQKEFIFYIFHFQWSWSFPPWWFFKLISFKRSFPAENLSPLEFSCSICIMCDPSRGRVWRLQLRVLNPPHISGSQQDLGHGKGHQFDELSAQGLLLWLQSTEQSAVMWAGAKPHPALGLLHLLTATRALGQRIKLSKPETQQVKGTSVQAFLLPLSCVRFQWWEEFWNSVIPLTSRDSFLL